MSHALVKPSHLEFPEYPMFLYDFVPLPQSRMAANTLATGPLSTSYPTLYVLGTFYCFRNIDFVTYSQAVTCSEVGPLSLTQYSRECLTDIRRVITIWIR